MTELSSIGADDAFTQVGGPRPSGTRHVESLP
jgi:hypothetical protein